MSESSSIRIEEVDEDLSSPKGYAQSNQTCGEELDNTTEDMMTDMKLDDDMDEVRSLKPDFNWLFHIEVYPWNADDLTEHFVKLIKLAQFSQLCLRKKDLSNEASNSETMEYKLSTRERIGCLHLYTNNGQSAKSIMRSAIWKTMSSKQLVFELTRQCQGEIETATLKLDTNMASKTKFRDKAKGQLKERSAKVSNLPGTISRDFLDVVFSRAYAVIEGTTVKEYMQEKENKLHQKLLEIKDFNGSLDFDCLGRGSCRAFVLGHLSVTINGQKLTIEANDKETMVAPPAVGVNFNPDRKVLIPNVPHGRGRGSLGKVQGPSLRGANFADIQEFSKAPVNNVRGRGIGRIMHTAQRPATAPLSRPGSGMPVPMTGRQKMNEKMRRNNFNLAPAGTTQLNNTGFVSNRGPAVNSVGDSFKLELESLQCQLERSTQALEAKIAKLQQSTQAAAYYHGDVLQEEDWVDADYEYGGSYNPVGYHTGVSDYSSKETQSYHFSTHQPIRPQRLKSGNFMPPSSGMANMHQVTGTSSLGPKPQNTASYLKRGDSRGGGGRNYGLLRTPNTSNYW